MASSPSLRLRLALAAVASIGSGTAASAADIHVPADQPTIQQGIAAATDGDRVLVDPGTYVENIDFLGKNIEVSSTGGADLTRIDGGHVDVVVKFESGETQAAILSGFTLRNGLGLLEIDGGAVTLVKSSPTLRDNVLVDNDGCSGGGLVGSGGSPRIIHNRIVGNQALCWSSAGGGLSLVRPERAVVTDNTIEHNAADFGGGIALTGARGDARIERNLVKDNDAAIDSGGVWSSLSRSRIANNVVTHNRNGGIGLYFPAKTNNRVTLVNNTIADNLAEDLEVDIVSGRFEAYNNIIRTSRATHTVVCITGHGGQATISHNLVHASKHATAYGDCDLSDGLVTRNPMFLGGKDAHGYWLAPGSPAIDAGDNAAAARDRRDASDAARIVDGTVDLGAYEFRGD